MNSSTAKLRFPDPPSPLVLRTIDDLDGCRPISTGLSPDMTLSQFFERYFLPVYLRSSMADPNTIAEYRTAVRHWARLVWDPPLRAIDNAACAAFVVEDLEREDGRSLSPNTVRKHCGALQMILSAAGPQTRDCPFAATPYGLFGDDPFGRPRQVPWFNKPPSRDKPPVDGLSIDEIGRLLDVVARHAQKPVLAECTAAAWWRAILLFGYNTGLRRKALLRLRRSWIAPTAAGGLLNLPAKASKHGRPKPIYCSPAALAVLAALPTGDLAFPWLETVCSLNRYRKKLWALAGLTTKGRGFHGLRKALATELWPIDKMATQLQLGHESQATTIKSYVNPAAIGRAMDQSVGPAHRRIRQPRPAGGQLTLF